MVLGAIQLSAASRQHLTGIVSEAMWGGSHIAKDKTAAGCTAMCVKGGSKYALAVGDKVYTLAGHEAELDELAGEKATVKGEVKGNAVQVQSVSAAARKQ